MKFSKGSLKESISRKATNTLFQIEKKGKQSLNFKKLLLKIWFAMWESRWTD